MSTASKELKYHFCDYHIERYNFNTLNPGYRFNVYHSFINRRCSFTGCYESAIYECIGVLIPDTIPEKLKSGKVEKELFRSAKHLLDNGTSLERLIVFLKTKIIPIEKSVICDKIIRHHAKAILAKLEIDENQSISDVDKKRILDELELNP
jgi:hypothetical protein